jgi:predicted house-cleaning noncanonical NTP pyrophosphatase (MazG superfamily)
MDLVGADVLFKKIAEEFTEAEAGGVITNLGLGKEALLEELADLTEVIQAMVKFRGWTIADLERVRKRKRRENGGFEKRFVLEGWWRKK